MNVFGQRKRSWRKSRKRGVSPIIATILLVAITVVLDAVLYVLISGLTKGPGSTPIGTAFAAGNPVAGTCLAAQVTNHQCAVAGNEIFTVTIEQSTVTMSSILLEVKNPGGSAFANTLAGGFAIMPITGAIPNAYYSVAAGAGLAMTSQFTYTGTFSGSSPITTTMTITVDTGIAAANWTPGAGNYLVGLGVGSYSGTSQPTTLP